MPGILGLISTNHFQAGSNPEPGAGPLEACLDRMIRSMNRRSWFELKKRVLPERLGDEPLSFGLASLALGGKDTLAERDGFLLAYCGEIILDESLRSRLRNTSQAPAILRQIEGGRLAEGLLGLVLDAGRDDPGRVLSGLNGLYVIAVWDERRKKLAIVNDRYGLQRMYYRCIPAGFMFASEIKALSWDPGFRRKISELAIADLLVAGHPLDDRTFFEDINALPGASLLTFQDGHLTVQQYWEPSFSDPTLPNRRSEDNAIDGLAHHIHQAVARRTALWSGQPATGQAGSSPAGRACLLLTGGLDSRIIAGMLAQDGLARPSSPLNVLAFTIGLADSTDVSLARRIARATGLAHWSIPIAPDYLAHYSQECLIRAEGHLNCHAAWIFAQDPFLLEHEIRFAMTGLFGEVISGRNWFPRTMVDLSPVEALQWYQGRVPGGLEANLNLLNPAVSARVKGESLRSIHRTLAHSGSRNPLDQFDYLHLRQKIRRHAGSSDVLEDFCRVMDPFVDNDLVDFSLRIPADLRIRGRLYKKMITRHLPLVAAIEVNGSDRPLRQMVMSENALAYRLITRGRRIYRRIRRQAPARPWLAGDPTGSAIHYNEWIRTASRQFILDQLSPAVLDQRLPGIFDPAAVSRRFEQYMAGKTGDFQTLGALVTISLWSAYFAGQSSHTGVEYDLG